MVTGGESWSNRGNARPESGGFAGFSIERVRSNVRATNRLVFHLIAVERLTAPDSAREQVADAIEDLADEALPAPAAAARSQLVRPPAAKQRPIPHEGAITCVLADDHPIVTESISEVLARNGFDVVARAKDGQQALAAIARLRPVIALVDLRLPVIDGAEVARQATRIATETAVILYTGADPLLLSSALESGARGFLLKEAPISDLARAVKMVAHGGVYLDPALAGFLMDSPARHDLTRQELEILRLLAGGCTNEAIGKHLYLSPETVRTHIRKLMAKLNVHTRTEAVATALRERLIA